MWAAFPALALVAFAADDAEEQYRYLAGLAERGLHDLVTDEAQAFLERHPRHARTPLVRFRLGEALFATSRFDDALGHFARLDRRTGFEFASEVDLRRGQCALELGRPDDAEPALLEVLEGNADYLRLPATLLLGEARLASGEHERADARFAAVLSAEPNGDLADDARHGRVWCAREAGDLAAAIARADEFLKAHGSDPRAGEIWLVRGECEYRSGRHEAALTSYARATEAGQMEAALRGTGFVLAALERHAEAARAHASLLSRFPDSSFAPESTLHLGIERLRAGQVEAAREAFADPRCPATAESAVWTARAARAGGDLDGALASVRSGLGRQPDPEQRVELEHLRGELLLELDRDEQAAEAFESAGDALGLQAAAVTWLDLDEPTRALTLARRSAERDEVASSPELARQAARIEAEALFTLERWEPSIAAFEAALERTEDPAERAACSLRIGWARFRLTQHEEALASFDRAAASARSAGADATLAEATFMGARAAEQLGRTERALAGYDVLLGLGSEVSFRSEALLRRARATAGEAGEALLDTAVREGGRFASQARFERAERRSERGALEAAASDYAALLENDASAFDGAAGYGLAWCEFGLEQYARSASRLERLVDDVQLERSLELSCLELMVWSSARAGETSLSLDAVGRLAELGASEASVLEAARVAAGALVADDRRSDATRFVIAVRESLRDPALRAAGSVEAAWLALDGGDLEGAEVLLGDARALDPDSVDLAEATFFVGEAHFERGAFAPARARYAEAAPHAAPELAPSVLYKLGFAQLETEAPREAAASFERLVAEHPEHDLTGEALYLAGEARFRADDDARAIQHLSQQLERYPRHATRPKALFRLGISASRTGDHARAADVLTQLAQRHPQFEARAEGELWRGRSLASLGREREARAAFARALDWDGGESGPTQISARTRIELGRLAEGRGELEEALSEFLKVAVLFAHPEEVSEALYRAGSVLEAQGQAEQARARYQEAADRFPETTYGARAAGVLAG